VRFAITFDFSGAAGEAGVAGLAGVAGDVGDVGVAGLDCVSVDVGVVVSSEDDVSSAPVDESSPLVPALSLDEFPFTTAAGVVFTAATGAKSSSNEDLHANMLEENNRMIRVKYLVKLVVLTK